MNPAIYYLSSLEVDVPYVPTPIEMPDGKTWDQKNLNTSRYSDGTLIPRITTGAAWAALTTGGCRFYGNDSTNAALFGRLYNWYAVNGIDGSGTTKDIAPEGWRVAKLSDWQGLASFYGTNGANSNTTAGGYLKEPGTIYWQPSNSILTPPSGFNARGGGFASGTSGVFDGIYTAGYWWPFGEVNSQHITMVYNTTTLGYGNAAIPNRGYSVRLIKKDIIISGFTTTLGTALAKSVPTGGDIPTYTEIPTEVGIAWGTSIYPNIVANNKIQYTLPYSLGPYSIDLPGLSPNTTYHIRAYAKISSGTAYAEDVVFTTRDGIPLLTTDTASSITASTATCGGNITDDGGDTITARGVCWNITGSPTIANSKTIDGGGAGSFTSNMTSLSPDQTYYVRAYATNSVTTSYGNEISFTTVAVPITPILDLYPTSVHHAYSLRKLRTAYTGACIKVRRTTTTPATSTTFDVGFDSVTGVVSFNSPLTNRVGTASAATTLGQFAEGTVDGLTAQPIYVVTWYDQSTNTSTKNPTQATPGNQPRLIDVVGGVATLEKSGGKVAVRFIRTSNTRLTIADTTANISNMSSYFVGAFLTTGTTQNVYALSVTNRFYLPAIVVGAIYAGYAGDASSILLNTLTLDRKLYELLAPAPGSVSTIGAWSNGISKGTNALSSGAISNIWLGHANNLNSYDGYIQEVIGWQSNANRLEKETNINSYWKVF